jgi:tetratricopeptide (TPR) repeat protein
LEDFSTLVKEKSALFLIAFVDAVLTLIAEGKASPRDWPFTFMIRLGNAILSYVRYLGKAFWPFHLGYLYPHPGYSLHWGPVWWSFALLIAITVLVLLRQRQRYLAVGWFWFLGSLVPMIGLVQINLPAMADRWAYIAFIGIFIMVCWTVADWAEANALRTRLVQALSAAVLLVLAPMTCHQLGFWSDDIAIWQHSSEINQHNWMAEQMVGNLLAQHGEMKQALPHWYRAEADAPENRAINLAIADAERQTGNFKLAIHYYGKVLAFDNDNPQNEQAWINMGLAYSALGDKTRANGCYAQGHRLRALHPPPSDVIDWQGAWWHDIGPYLHRRWQQFRSSE